MYAHPDTWVKLAVMAVHSSIEPWEKVRKWVRRQKKSQQECMGLQVSNQFTVSGGVAARKVLVLWMIRVDKATCCTTL